MIFLLDFWNSDEVYMILKQRIVFIAYVFPKLGTAKDIFMLMSKKTSFRTPFDSYHFNGCQTLLNSARQHFYHVFLLF